MARRKKRRKNRGLILLAVLLPVLLAVLILLLFLVREQEKNVQSEPEPTENVILPETESEPAPAPEPIEVTETVPEPEVSAGTTLLFTGDILLHNATLSRYQAEGLTGILSNDLIAEFQDADILMVNEEFPFSNGGVPALDKEFTFRVDPTYVSAFLEMGVDLVGLANNHILDYGTEALLDTITTLDAAGIRYAGVGADLARAKEPQIIEVNGKRFAFLAASRVWPDASWSAGAGKPGVFGTYDPAQLLEEIRSCKESGCDFVTVFVHWGIERNTVPEDYQRELAGRYTEAGADLVIGAHPHVLQGIEYVNGTPVFYSLGNFIFGGQTYQTAAVRVTVSPDGEAEIEVIPCLASGGFTRRAEGADAATVFQTLNGLSFSAALDENGVLFPQ